MPTNTGAWSNDLRLHASESEAEGKMDEAFMKALQQERKKVIEKLERDLKLLEAQREAFDAEGLKTEKGEALRDGINGARNALDVFRVAYERALPLQSWEHGGK